MSRLRVVFIVLGAIGVTAQASAQAPSAGDSVSIAAARATYTEVLSLAAAHALSIRDSAFACSNEDLAPLEFRLERDTSGVVRRLIARWGSEDSAGETEYYYDSRGRLRFAFLSQSAVNGATVELRWYFDAAGRTVRKLRRTVRGPGYPVDEIPVVADVGKLRAVFCGPPGAG